MSDLSEQSISEKPEIKTFKVVNRSIRVVHIGGLMIAPESSADVIDDELGINRRDVESSEFIDFDETDVEVEPVPAKSKAALAKAKNQTATGTGWSNKA